MSATGSSTSNYDVSGIVYDKNGNLLNLVRRGAVDANATSFGTMDFLSYYYDGGNKLVKVWDRTSTTYGFKDDAPNTSPDPTDDYTYDANGNMLTDTNKGISNIIYNHLNLPTQVTIGGQHINYTYDGSGVKLRKVVGGTTTDYAGNTVYENNTLQFFNHSEGYVKKDNTGFKYVYQYKDHLGNIRLSYTDNNNDGVITPSTEIVEESNYYPFGLKHKGYNNVISSHGNSVAQKKGFANEELEEELGKNTVAFQWRDYDPAIARFNKIDRFAEKYHSHSTYAFTKNNPIRFQEIKGDSLWISFGSKNQHKVLYQNGKLTNADGSRYEGAGVKVKKDGSLKIKNSFLKKTVSALNKLSQAEGETGTNVVSTLQGSKNNFTIVQGMNRFKANQPGDRNNIDMNDSRYFESQILGKAPIGGGPPSNTIGAGGTIYWNPSDNSSYITRNGTNSGNSAISLGHELFHAYDSNNGELDGRIMSGGTLRMEGRAVYFGNQLRSTNTFGNQALRYRYSSGGTILAPNNNPLNITPPSIEVLKN